MKTKLFKSLVLSILIVGLFYAFTPKKVEARWDFDRGTGTWTNDGGGWWSCHGSWWSNGCIVTGGAVHEDGIHEMDENGRITERISNRLD
jgi:hypothetical protein